MGERISALQQLVSRYGKVLTIPSEISFSSDIHDQTPLSFSADRHSISTSRGDAIHSVSSRTSQGLLLVVESKYVSSDPTLTLTV